MPVSGNLSCTLSLVFQIMTDETIEEDINLFEDDSRELSHFLKHHVPDMIHEIKRNLRSHAFDGL